jgi:hypothetical protein
VSIANGAKTVGPASCSHDHLVAMLVIPRCFSYHAARTSGFLAGEEATDAEHAFHEDDDNPEWAESVWADQNS